MQDSSIANRYRHQHRRKLLPFARDNTLVGGWIAEYDKHHDAGLVSSRKSHILCAFMESNPGLGEHYQDIVPMIFRFRGKEFKGLSWIDVVRSLERDDKEYRSCGGPIRQYLTWSLNQLRGTVPPRDIDLSDRLEDETLALGYLLLLDEYGVGEIVGPIDRTRKE